MRTICSEQDIHFLIGNRVMKLGEITGVPLEADAGAMQIIRAARKALSLPGN